MKNFPNAFVIIIAVIIFAWILTFIIPKGSYQRLNDPETGRTFVVPNSYRPIDTEQLSLFDLMLAIPRGIIGRAETIVLILLTGGCFYVIEKTGALTQGLNQLIRLLRGKEVLSLVIISVLFVAGGATIGLQEEVIAMTPILLFFGRSLGYNAPTVIFISFGSSIVGSAFSPFNPFAAILAQKEAELELLSGSQFRLIVLLIVAISWVSYIIIYTNRTQFEKVISSDPEEPLTSRNMIILSMLALTFVGVTYGLIKMDWGFNEISACFFGLGMVSGLIGKLGMNKSAELYTDGFKEMIFAAMIVGLANSISLILSEGMIIDTIVQSLFGPLQHLPKGISAVIMMVSHSILHFPIPSYSGQAVMTMPILIPLSDLIGLSRQVCVLSYQYGAVMMDMIIPTNGALMAILAISGVLYNQWLKFVARATLMIMVIAAIAILIGVAIGY